MPWWAWLLLGMVLLGGEAVAPGGFYLLFFGVGALAVGLLGLFVGPGPVWLQWLLFSALSLGALVLLRPRLLGRLRTPERPVDDSLVGEVVTVAGRLAPGAAGRGELRGSSWSVVNAGSAPLEDGERVRVERVEGLTLHVRKEA